MSRCFLLTEGLRKDFQAAVADLRVRFADGMPYTFHGTSILLAFDGTCLWKPHQRGRLRVKLIDFGNAVSVCDVVRDTETIKGLDTLVKVAQDLCVA